MVNAWKRLLTNIFEPLLSDWVFDVDDTLNLRFLDDLTCCLSLLGKVHY